VCSPFLWPVWLKHFIGAQEIQQRLSTLMNTHTTSTVPRLYKFSSTQTQLTIRLLKLIQHLHLLIPSVRSSSIKPEEEDLRNKLEEIESILLGGGGRIRGKLGELWAVVGALRARENAKAAGRNGEQWRVVDEEGLARIVQILQEQQAGLAHLTQVLRKDMKDLNFVLSSDSNENGMDVESLFSSPSGSLRASVLR
jgi:nuclear pore complex protein Nup54